MSEECSIWNRLASHSLKGYTRCVAAGSNKNNYILMEDDAIWKYNFEYDTWSKILDKQNGFKFGRCSGVLTDNGQQLFILDRSGKLANLKLTDNSFNIINNNVKEVGEDAKSMIIKNTLNVIGGHLNSSHLIWNEKRKKFELATEIYDCQYLYGFGLTHVEKTNSLLLFGGFEEASFDYMDQILEYNTEEEKWSKLQILLPKPLYRPGCALALNNKYVIICGGQTCQIPFETDSIYIYDIKNKSIKESQQKCPIKGCMSAITIHDDLCDEKTVCGYVRRQWNNSNIDQHYFPPLYILNIIKTYFYNEYLYLFEINGDGNHYKINTSDIL
eukprot:537148_1